MHLIKKGYGTAKHPADLAVVKFRVFTKSKNKNNLLDKFLNDYEFFSKKINSFIENNEINNKIKFINYSVHEHEINVEKKSKVQYITDYYYINGIFELKIPIVNNDRNIISKLIDFIDLLYSDISIFYDISFVLSEETKAKVMAQATNNAIDNIKIEVKDITSHLGLSEFVLEYIDFCDNTSGSNIKYQSAMQMEKRMGKEEKIALLDDMLNGSDIIVHSSFTSKWKLE